MLGYARFFAFLISTTGDTNAESTFLPRQRKVRLLLFWAGEELDAPFTLKLPFQRGVIKTSYKLSLRINQLCFTTFCTWLIQNLSCLCTFSPLSKSQFSVITFPSLAQHTTRRHFIAFLHGLCSLAGIVKEIVEEENGYVVIIAISTNQRLMGWRCGRGEVFLLHTLPPPHRMVLS